MMTMLAFLSSPAFATADQTETYQAAFFDQYAPRNALEMVQQLPGFTFDEGSSERGFGSNASNVLIDGVRPTTKSGGIEAALTRIPAIQVSRIELLRGNTGEAEGHALIANVVIMKSQTSGSWAMRARQTKSTKIKPNVEAVFRTPIGQWETAFDLDIGINPHFRSAQIERHDSQESLSATATEANTADSRIDYFNGEGTRGFAGGKLTINGRLAWDKYNGNIMQHGYSDPTGISDSTWSLNQLDRSKLGELGLDWTKTNDNWKIRLLGLGIAKDSHYQYDYHQQNDNGQAFNSHYEQDGMKTEFVTRATFSDVSNAAVKPEFGAEITNNRLDTKAQYGQVGALAPVFGSDVVVEEWRSEAFANVVYQPTTALTIEGGLTVEASKIEVTGDASAKQSFTYIKPRFTANYQVNDKTRLIFEAERRVGQLDFRHFAANSVADEQRNNAGNPDLAPSQTDEVSATFDWRFSDRGSFKIEAYHKWRKDILEQIILSTDDQGNINQGRGNAGDARSWGILSSLKLPLDSFITVACLI